MQRVSGLYTSKQQEEGRRGERFCILNLAKRTGIKGWNGLCEHPVRWCLWCVHQWLVCKMDMHEKGNPLGEKQAGDTSQPNLLCISQSYEVRTTKDAPGCATPAHGLWMWMSRQGHTEISDASC